MVTTPRYLIWIGDAAWVDPHEVIAVDAHFEEGEPSWARVRIILRTNRVIFGTRDPQRVVAAIRRPELENEAEEVPEDHPSTEDGPERLRPRRTQG